MKEIKTFLPAEIVESFKKFADKTVRNVEGFAYSVGKPYDKVFIHRTINPDGKRGNDVKKFHEICDLTIMIPEEKDWRLVATFKDGAFTPVDPTQELHFKNPRHGAEYGKCDYCGHWCINSYVIENVKTGDELQVGCECIKKFGLNGVCFLSEFTRKLYETYGGMISYATDEEFGDLLPIWKGDDDKSSWKDAIFKADMIMAAKAQYDICPIYKKGERIGNYFYRSETLDSIDNILVKKSFKMDDAYVKAVCEFGAKIEPKTEFEEGKLAIVKNFYCFRTQSVYAFFLVKAYEDSLKPKSKIEKGMQVKVVGKVIQQRHEETYYGITEINSILTDKGVSCQRIGKISTTKENGVTRTVFYAIVKDIRNGIVHLDRATKNPKKGKSVIEI